MKKYLIDYELRGTLVVETTNPQAASARGLAVLRAVVAGLNPEQADDTEIHASRPVDLAEKCKPVASRFRH